MILRLKIRLAAIGKFHSRFTFATVSIFYGSVAMGMDVSALWDASKPELSEQRFRDALTRATGDDAVILQTQIARTFGLRGDFVRAQQILQNVEPSLSGANAEARARHALEYGRTLSSATHKPESQTADIKSQARGAYARAVSIAKTAKLDDLTIDALHMMAFIDTGPADQLKWAQDALLIAETSSQLAAQRWQGSLYNNQGYALHQLRRYEEALAAFRRSLAAHERFGKPAQVRVAKWMIAWTLRSLARGDEAIAMQLALEQENDVVGSPDPYVFEELETLYAAKGDAAQADAYRKKRAALRKS
jgi:tetratricopeptide (TPR) repeat protein